MAEGCQASKDFDNQNNEEAIPPPSENGKEPTPTTTSNDKEPSRGSDVPTEAGVSANEGDWQVSKSAKKRLKAKAAAISCSSGDKLSALASPFFPTTKQSSPSVLRLKPF